MKITGNPTTVQHVINTMCDLAHGTALSRGWYDQERNDLELIALIHSELSEAVEALRDGDLPYNETHPKAVSLADFKTTEIELADAVIRIFDMAAYKGYKLGDAIVAKMQYNTTRSKRHGGKKY